MEITIKTSKMEKETTYTYQTKFGLNVETFTSSGYVTLIQNGIFKYEHHFGSHMINLQEQLLVSQLEERSINYTRTTK